MTPAVAEASPDEQQAPTPDPQPRWGENNRDLPKQLVSALESAVRKAQTQERFLRRLEVLRDRRNRYYVRGHQHIYETQDGFRMAIPGAPWSDANGNEYEWGDFVDDYNITHGFEWIVESVLTQSPTGIEFQPIDPSKSEDNQAAETADGLRQHFNRMNDVRQLARETVRMMWCSGRIIRWVKTVENAAKFGKKDDGIPKKERICKVYGTLESKVPITEKEQCAFRYLILYNDLDVLNAKDDYPWIRKQIRAGENCLDENNYEKFARLGVLMGATSEFQAGESIAHLTTEGNIWLRPSCFSDDEFDKPFEGAEDGDMVEDEMGNKNPPSIRDIFAAEFPEGVHVVFVGKNYAECWAESMDDCLFTGRPFSDDSQFPLAIGDGAIVPQDAFNDQMNYARETFAFGAPRKYVVAGDTEFAAIMDQKAQPYAFTQLKQSGTDQMPAADRVHQDPNPELPGTMQPYVEFLMGSLLQFILSCPPSIWGDTGEGVQAKTATGQQLATNQAKGRLGIIWSVLQTADAVMYTQVALSAANDPDTPEEITVPVSNGQNVVIRAERLRKGHFLAKPDEDSGFPDSTNAIRGVLQQVFQLMLELPQLAGQFFNPQNLKEFMRVYGLSNFVLPEAEAGQRQLEEIEELLAGVPIEPTPEEIAQAQAQDAQKQQMVSAAHQQVAANAAATGQLMPPMPPTPPPFDPATAASSPDSPWQVGTLSRPSVPINPWDFDQWHLEACDDYLNSDACRIELQIGRPDIEGNPVPNVRGIQNVWLHRQMHAKAIAAKTPNQPPPVPVRNPAAAKGKPPAPPAGVPPPA